MPPDEKEEAFLREEEEEDARAVEALLRTTSGAEANGILERVVGVASSLEDEDEKKKLLRGLNALRGVLLYEWKLSFAEEVVVLARTEPGES